MLRPQVEQLTLHQAIECLQHLLALEDDPLGAIRTVRDLYQYRALLRRSGGTDTVISHVAQIIIDATNSGQRMRTLDCLKTLRSLAKSVDSDSLSRATIEKLFRIYQQFVFNRNDEIKWCVSVILKDKPLPASAIEWLIQNCANSEHVLNRLLRYPTAHPTITSWAGKAYRDGFAPGRRSELVALLINPANAASFARSNDSNTLCWGIFKARIPNRQKIALLKKYCSFESFASVVEIAGRLNSRDLLSHFQEKLKNQEQHGCQAGL